MRFRAVICCCLTLAVASAYAGDNDTSVRKSTDRLDGIFQGCGGAGNKRSAANPFGLRDQQWQSAEANRRFLRGTRSRAEAMEEATSKPVRIVFHQPGGWFLASRGGMRGAFPTVAVMNGRKKSGRELYPWRWSVWANELAAMAKAHPDWILGVYFSGQVPTADAQDAVDARQEWEIYDDDNGRHRRLVMQVVDQWLAVGVREFLFDGAHDPKFSADIPELAAAIRSKGGRLFVESHPRGTDKKLRMALLEQIDGSLSTRHFMVSKEPASLDWIVPPGKIMMVALTGHGSSKNPARSTPAWSEIRSYRRRGFSVLSGRRAFDHFASQANTGTR